MSSESGNELVMGRLKMLHLDVSGGCSSDMLLGSVAELGVSLEKVKDSLRRVGIHDRIPATHSDDLARKSGKIFVWQLTSAAAESAAVQNWQQLNDRINDSTLSPREKGTVLRVFSVLADSFRQTHGDTDYATAGKIDEFSNDESLIKMLAEVVAFCAMIAHLDPAAISASKVLLSLPQNEGPVDVRSWLLSLAEDILSCESKDALPPSNVVGLALLKSFAASFGVRGESTILKTGLGISVRSCKGIRAEVRASLCDFPRISSHQADRKTSPLLVQSSVKIETRLGAAVDGEALVRRLIHLGGTSIRLFHEVTPNSPFTNTFGLSCVAGNSQLNNILEALLVLGSAPDVVCYPVEQHRLQKKTTALPYGRHQSEAVCKVNEWKLGGETVRVEADADDVASIADTHGFSQESVRADVMSAWKRWKEAH